MAAPWRAPLLEVLGGESGGRQDPQDILNSITTIQTLVYFFTEIKMHGRRVSTSRIHLSPCLQLIFVLPSTLESLMLQYLSI